MAFEQFEAASQNLQPNPETTDSAMVLVGYSDSEGSDSDSAPAQSKRSAPKTAPKLVDPATNKVKVNLSSLTLATDAAAEQDARPAKRQRTGGGLNINAFLPAPKQLAKPLTSEGNFAAKKAGEKGLGRGVNLKTGAEPAFTRGEASSNLKLDGEPKDIKDVIAELRRSRPTPAAVSSPAPSDELPKAEEKVKLVGNAMRFRPKSVAQGPVKKKVVVPGTSQAASATQPARAAPSRSIADSTPVVPVPVAKAKVSLFSMGGDNSTSALVARTDFFAEDEEDTDMAEAPNEAFEDTPQPQQPYNTTHATPSASAAVDGLNLSAADMRQLFGRKAGKGGMPDLDDIKMVNFSADEQYAANEEIRAKGETASINPVRGIAPGKHSLKQLVNAAATQADALEEHFAQGKRNRNEAGSRYGW